MSYLKDDPAYSDLEPIYLTEDEQKIVHVICPEDFLVVMGYFRALFAKLELSQRALDLTGYAVRLNPSNYTIWHYRRLCIDALNYSWERELRFVKEFCENHPKSYQVWHHRKCCCEKIQSPYDEYESTLAYIKDDLKNYHVWSYRQWIIKTYPYELSHGYIQQWVMNHLLTSKQDDSHDMNNDEDNDDGNNTTTINIPNDLASLSHDDLKQQLNMLTSALSDQQKMQLAALTIDQFRLMPFHVLPIWTIELDHATELLQLDIRNNSAWNQRAFVIQFGYGISLRPRPRPGVHKTTQLTHDRIDHIFLNEIRYCVESLSQVTKNESAWNYIGGLTRSYHCRLWPIIIHLSYYLLLSNSQNRFALSSLVELLLLPHVGLYHINIQQPMDIQAYLLNLTGKTDDQMLDDLKQHKLYIDDDTPNNNHNDTSSSSTSPAHSQPDTTKPFKIASLPNLQEASRLCEVLIKVDALRFKYWIHRKNQIDTTIQHLQISCSS